MPSLTGRAEKALLGAMLLTGGTVMPRVSGEDFADQAHRAMFTMIGQASFGPPVTREYLNEVKRACPDPDHAPAYAQMVIEAGLRCYLLSHALRLEHAAGDLHHHARRLAGIASPGSTAEDLLNRALGTGNDRVEAVERLLSHELLVSLALREHIKAFDPDRDSDPQTAAATPGIDGFPAMTPVSAATASWHTAMSLRPGPDAGTEREECVLASIIGQQHQSTAIPRWLSAQAFTDPACRDLFTAITRLYARGEPIDELTVDWERARHQATTPGVPGPDTNYGARLAHLHTDPAAALRAARQMSHDYQNSGQDTDAVQQLTRDQPAAGIPRLLQAPPGAPGHPGHGPQM